METIGAPAARGYHTAVWTGEEMLVWGGFGGDYLNDGGAYDPVSDSWRPIAASSLDPRIRHSAIWTGSRMIIWGGHGASGSSYSYADGAMYLP